MLRTLILYIALFFTNHQSSVRTKIDIYLQPAILKFEKENSSFNAGQLRIKTDYV